MGWILIAVTVENADNLMDLFKDHTVQFFLNSITKIPNAGTGAVGTAAQTIVGVKHWNANLRNYNNTLTQLHQLILNQVRALSGWFMGE